MIYSYDIVRLKPDVSLMNISILIKENKPLFFTIENPRPGYCYEFYPSWPAVVYNYFFCLAIYFKNCFSFQLTFLVHL